MDIALKFRNWTKVISEAVLPRSLFLPGLPQRKPIRIRIGTFPPDEAARMAARQAKHPVIAVLDPALTLRRQVSLPKAVGAKAESAIALQLRQTLPGQGQGLVWRAAAVERSASSLTYAIYLLKQTQLDDVLASFRALGAEIEAVVIDAAGLEPIWQRFPESDRTAKLWLAFTALSVASVALLAVLSLESDRSELTDLVDVNAQRAAALEERLLAKRAEADRSTAESSALMDDLDRFTTHARRLQLLSDLTNVLPDTTWVSEMTISEDRIVLSGFTSGQVTDAIGLIQGLPWATEVELIGPISFDSYSGQNRFELGLRIQVGETG
jgi:general secretion pathway protein L